MHKGVYIAILRVLLFLSLIGVWELLVAEGVLDPFYTSKPTKVYQDLVAFYQSGALLRHTFVTLEESLGGLLWGTIIGIVMGFLLGEIRILGAIFEPFITAFYGIPKLALAPIFVLWFGLGVKSKVILSSLLVFYLVFFSTYAGVRNVNQDLVTSVRLMGANRWQVMLKVTFPSCTPWILSGIRGGLGASLIGAIVGEYMGASAGLGWMISYAASFFRVDRVMSCIFILFFIGILFNQSLKYIERKLLKWRMTGILGKDPMESV